jgi:hypothetical protein
VGVKNDVWGYHENAMQSLLDKRGFYTATDTSPKINNSVLFATRLL